MIQLNRKVRFSHPDFSYYAAPAYSEFLLGSILLKVTANIQVVVSWGAIDVDLVFDNAAGTITRTDNGSFLDDGFRDGDGIVISSTALNNGSIAPGLITVTEDVIYLAGVVNETVNGTIEGYAVDTSFDFYPNLIENNDDFSLFNLTDRETVPMYFADTISTDSANPTIMQVSTNSKGWISPADSATIYKDSASTTTEQIFVIQHTFSILPIFRSNELREVQNGLPPAAKSFKDRFCLKYVYKIDGKFSPLDPTIVHTTDGNVVFPNGNVGWFDEFINGRPTTYTKESISYSNNTTGKSLSGIEYCAVTNVDARIQAVGSMVESKFIVHVMYLPLNEDRYINTLTDWKTNFIYERAVVTYLGATVQGENTGDYHFLKDVSFTSLDAGFERGKITFKIDFSDVVRSEIECFDLDNRNYLIFVTCQKYNTDIFSLNQTALRLDVNTYKCDKDDPDLFKIIDEVQFFGYPRYTGTGYSDVNDFTGDLILSKTQFHLQLGYELHSIIMKEISFNIIASNENDLNDIVLETFTINTSNFLPNCEDVQEIYFNQDRDFILTEGDPRNDIRLFRVPQLDYASGRTLFAAYEFIYPFKLRWEEWRKLDGFNNCFPTPTHNWDIYDREAGWSIKVSIKAEVEKNIYNSCSKDNPHTTSFEHISWININDPCDIPYSVQIETFDEAALNSYEGVIANDANTFVEATFTGDFNTISTSDLYGILTLDAYGIGGISYAMEIGDRLDISEDFVWYGASDTLKATLTKINNSTITLSAFLNYLYLPKDTDQFFITARLGNYRLDASSSGADCFNNLFVDAFTCGELVIVEVIDSWTFLVSGVVRTAEIRDVYVDSMELTWATATTWGIGPAGTIDGRDILSGNISGGVIVKAPASPYTDANVGEKIQGEIMGTLTSGFSDCPEDDQEATILYYSQPIS